MATNPIQRQKRNSFLLGILVMLIIASIIIAILFMQLVSMKKKQQEEEQSYRDAYVVAVDVKSGEKIDLTKLKKVQVVRDAVPADAVTDSTFIDSEGNIREDLIAKISLNSGTVLTVEMLVAESEQVTADLRKQEYNMITLPSQIQDGDYIDIRLRLGNGQDFIVVSKKQVTIPKIAGVDSEDTIWINLTEGEIVTMSNAIVEAYRMKGAELCASTYVEPGMQTKATPTYVPSYEVLQLIQNDPNIVQEAKQELLNKANSNSSLRNEGINKELEKYTETGDSNLETNVEEHKTKSKEDRKDYLDALNGLVVQ